MAGWHLDLNRGLSGCGAWHYFHLFIVPISPTFIYQTTPHFSLDEVSLFFTIYFIMWVAKWRPSLFWESHLEFLLTLGKSFLKASAFLSVRGGGWTGCVLSGSNTLWVEKSVFELVQPVWSEANVGLCQLPIKKKQPCSLAWKHGPFFHLTLMSSNSIFLK